VQALRPGGAVLVYLKLVGRLVEAFLDRSAHGATLRSCTPFTGVLSQDEVQSIKKAYRELRDTASSG
jgi:hypothetical protein